MLNVWPISFFKWNTKNCLNYYLAWKFLQIITNIKLIFVKKNADKAKFSALHGNQIMQLKIDDDIITETFTRESVEVRVTSISNTWIFDNFINFKTSCLAMSPAYLCCISLKTGDNYLLFIILSTFFFHQNKIELFEVFFLDILKNITFEMFYMLVAYDGFPVAFHWVDCVTSFSLQFSTYLIHSKNLKKNAIKILKWNSLLH